MGKFSRLLHNILFQFSILSIYLFFICLVSTTSTYSAPAPIPKVKSSDYLLGTWEVIDTGYKETWTFYKNGIWESKGVYRSHDVSGRWEIRHTNYLYINYRDMKLVHKLGTKKHIKYHEPSGDTWIDLKLIFVRKLSN